jgi:hypothetical protein
VSKWFGDIEEVLGLEDRIRSGDVSLPEDGVVNGRRSAVRGGIADDGEDRIGS